MLIYIQGAVVSHFSLSVQMQCCLSVLLSALQLQVARCWHFEIPNAARVSTKENPIAPNP